MSTPMHKLIDIEKEIRNGNDEIKRLEQIQETNNYVDKLLSIAIIVDVLSVLALIASAVLIVGAIMTNPITGFSLIVGGAALIVFGYIGLLASALMRRAEESHRFYWGSDDAPDVVAHQINAAREHLADLNTSLEKAKQACGNHAPVATSSSTSQLMTTAFSPAGEPTSGLQSERTQQPANPSPLI